MGLAMGLQLPATRSPEDLAVSESAATTWDTRIEQGMEAFKEWRELPLALLLDRVFKAAGFRDVVKERREAVDALRAYFAERDSASEYAHCAPTDETEAKMRAVAEWSHV